MGAGGLGDRGRGVGRLGAAVGGCVQGGDKGLGGAGNQVVDGVAAKQPRFDLVFAGLVQPGFLRRGFLFGFAQVDDAGLAESGFPAGALVHAAPQPQAFQRQRDLAGVAAHGAAPAPVATGLLAADPALLAQHDAVALLGQEQCG